MTKIYAAFLTLLLTATSSAAPMTEIKGVRPSEGCLTPPKAATGTLRTCRVDTSRIRIWCPNGKVFDRDEVDTGIAVLRSICELNQL